MRQSSRPLLFAALLVVSSFTSCQKTAVEPESSTPDSIVGRWELVQTSGGIGGGTRPADPAQRSELAFDAHGQARVLLNGALTTTAAYTLSQRVSYLTRRTETFLEFPASPAGSAFIAELSTTTLALSQDGNDGITATYRRE